MILSAQAWNRLAELESLEELIILDIDIPIIATRGFPPNLKRLVVTDFSSRADGIQHAQRLRNLLPISLESIQIDATVTDIPYGAQRNWVIKQLAFLNSLNNKDHPMKIKFRGGRGWKKDEWDLAALFEAEVRTMMENYVAEDDVEDEVEEEVEEEGDVDEVMTDGGEDEGDETEEHHA